MAPHAIYVRQLKCRHKLMEATVGAAPTSPRYFSPPLSSTLVNIAFCCGIMLGLALRDVRSMLKLLLEGGVGGGGFFPGKRVVAGK